MPTMTSQAASLLRQGRQLAERTTDPEGLPRLLFGYGIARLTAGETSEGLEAMREAEALTGELVEIDVWIGLALLSLGRLTESAETLERILAEESTELRWTAMNAPVNGGVFPRLDALRAREARRKRGRARNHPAPRQRPDTRRFC